MTLEMHQTVAIADALVVEEHVRDRYLATALWPDLHQFYADQHHLSDAELMAAMDKQFAHSLMDAICEPLGFFEGGCVFIALVLLRQGA